LAAPEGRLVAEPRDPDLARLRAAVELARRMARAELPERRILSRPVQVASYIHLRFARAGQEVMGALFLDPHQRLIADREYFRGSINRVMVEPRAILRDALASDAFAVLLFHSHPSGDPSPSREDLAFTRRFAKAGEHVGVTLVDHMIVGNGGRWLSLKARGGW
jgi:DNA repair protein RadC